MNKTRITMDIDEVIAMQNKIKGYEMALDELLEAYPIDIFPDTTQAERDNVDSIFISRTSAMMGRHLAKVIRERAAYFAKELEEALEIESAPAAPEQE